MDKLEKINKILKNLLLILIVSSLGVVSFYPEVGVFLTIFALIISVMANVTSVTKIIYIEEEYKRNDFLSKLEKFLREENVLKESKTDIYETVIEIAPKRKFMNNYVEIKFKEEYIIVKTSNRINRKLRKFKQKKKEV